LGELLIKIHSQYWITYCEENKAAQSMAKKLTYEELEKGLRNWKEKRLNASKEKKSW